MVVAFAQATAVALQKLALREDQERNLVDTITAFVNAIESKDPYLKGHSARVALYATEVARMMRLDPEMIDVVNRGAMLHDLGIPVIFDVTHSLQLPGAGDGVTGGDRRFAEPLALAAVAAGADGLFMEVHPDPANALSDAATQLPVDRAEALAVSVLEVRRAVMAGVPLA